MFKKNCIEELKGVARKISHSQENDTVDSYRVVGRKPFGADL